MFLSEKEMKLKFWEKYNGSGRALRWQFECPIREGNADLITIEKYGDLYQINAFEFKLNDIKKVILQAAGNVPYANKSWIVVPIEKKEVILNRYINELDEKKHIGVMCVRTDGTYEIIYKPKIKSDLEFNQILLNVCFASS